MATARIESLPVFKPSLLGTGLQSGVSDCIQSALKRCDHAFDFYPGIVLTGGSASIPGFRERVSADLATLFRGNKLAVVNSHADARIGAWLFDFCLSITTRFDNKHIRSCLASRRSVSGWGLVTHGAMALQPIGFRFRFIPRKVPGLSANPLGFRGGRGTMVSARADS